MIRSWGSNPKRGRMGSTGWSICCESGTPNGPYDPMSVDPEVDALTGPGPETIFGADGRTRINPTTGFPWRTIGLTASVFPGVNGWSWCSAAVVGPFHVLTAAHCVRNATTDASPNTFATSLEFVAASNGVRFSTTLDPDTGTQSTDRPVRYRECHLLSRLHVEQLELGLRHRVW